MLVFASHAGTRLELIRGWAPPAPLFYFGNSPSSLSSWTYRAEAGCPVMRDAAAARLARISQRARTQQQFHYCQLRVIPSSARQRSPSRTGRLGQLNLTRGARHSFLRFCHFFACTFDPFPPRVRDRRLDDERGVTARVDLGLVHRPRDRDLAVVRHALVAMEANTLERASALRVPGEAARDCPRTRIADHVVCAGGRAGRRRRDR